MDFEPPFLFPEMEAAVSLPEFDRSFSNRGYRRLAGVDEAGRGPLAGPVVAAAVEFDTGVIIHGIADSKKLTPSKRERLYEEILGRARAIGTGIIDSQEIDRINILQASLKAMRIAVENLGSPPDLLLIDGPFRIPLPIPQCPVTRGDSLSQSIAAASIVAKVTRDRMMESFHLQYPQYAFHCHKGYGTALHIQALKWYGCCPIHRRSFRTVRELEEGVHKGSPCKGEKGRGW